MAKKQQKKVEAAPNEAAAPATATPANFDSELDAFFKAVPPAPAPVPVAASTSASAAKAGPSNPNKRKATAQQVEEEPESDSDSDNEEIDDDEEDDNEDLEMEEGDGDLSSVDEELDDEGSLLFSQSEDEGDSDKEEEEDSEPYVPPKHESVTKSSTSTTAEPSKSSKKKSFKEAHEPSQTRDQRTLFIGNVPIETAQSRSLQRKLISFIESLSPYPIITKAHALRFRSVAFSIPTVHLDVDDSDDEGAGSKKKQKKGKSKERSQNYREAVAAVEGGENAQAPLTTQQKRKIAFINKDFHEKAKSVSAYVTIAHPQAVLEHLYEITPPKAKAKDSKSEPIQLDPRLTGPVLAALIASFADGQFFEGRHLRVDLVKSISPAEVLSSGLEKVKTFSNTLAGSSSSNTDPKTTLFVGGLDFETDEEEVRTFFEVLLTEELGPLSESLTVPVTGLDGEPAPPSLVEKLVKEFPFIHADQRKVKPEVTRDAEYVRSVRLIRDAGTQMGKGIGYVNFSTQQCVDEIMAIYNAEQAFLESIKGVKGSLGASAAIAAGGKEFKRRLKLGGRPIRVAYCKSQTKTSAPSARRGKKSAEGGEIAEPSTPQRKSPRYERSSGAPTPNGTSPHVAKRPTKITPGSPTASRAAANPAEIAKKAELYATLSKDQRKAMKKDDADRVNRRLEKKNKKFGAGFKKGDKSLMTEGEKVKSKERVKLRQPAAGSGGAKRGPPAGAGGSGGAKRFKSGPPGGAKRGGPPKGK